MKQFLNAVRMALYMVAIPLTITAAASAHQWFGTSSTEASVKLSHVVELSENGMVRGRVSTIGNGSHVASVNAVASLLKNGELVASAKTGVDGYFSFSGVKPGIYTLSSVGRNQVAAFAVELVENGSKAEASSVLRVVASDNDKLVRDLLSEAKANFVGGEESVSSVIGTSHSVRLNVAGNFEGKVESASNTASTVVLIADGRKVGEAKTDTEGRFTLNNIEPGTYSFLAMGEAGFVATAVELLEASPVYTSTAANQDAPFEVTMAQEFPEDEYEVVEETTIVEEVPAPVGPVAPMGAPGYGGYGGGGFGGGGGGIGGFNLSGVGDLIGLGIGAWALTEIIDSIDDNNNNNIPTPVPVPNPPTPISGFTYVYL